jgi:deoxyribodipyrimidine photolyase-related protein
MEVSMAKKPQNVLLLILGNQLFPIDQVLALDPAAVFMAEDHYLCSHFRYHQQKVVLVLAAMRAYADELRAAGLVVHYTKLEEESELSINEALVDCLQTHNYSSLVHFEVEGKAAQANLARAVQNASVVCEEIRSPMFLCDRPRFEAFVQSRKKPQMAAFYKAERTRLNILLTSDGKPVGEQWSFDADNRKKLPKDVHPPELPEIAQNIHLASVITLVAERFAGHPGKAEEFSWPSTRAGALNWLDDFIEHRLEGFGPYEDAMSTRSETVFHSVLSPMMNIGLLVPNEVLERVIAVAQTRDIPLQSLEGFVRQIMGWREFVRGIYQNFSAQQASTNYWSHHRQLTEHWYLGGTGIAPLDDTIEITQRKGWCHHIPRLMVVANLMTLCEIEPKAAHRWFMEMYVDSASWVMGPNVYGMGIFSDGGIFATKPYICGSNYLLKMSNYPKGPWCDVVDGLYWRFIEKNRAFFAQNPRLALMPRALDRLSEARRDIIFPAAEKFLLEHTHS